MDPTELINEGLCLLICDAVNGISNILPGSDQDSEYNQQYGRNLVMEAEEVIVNVDLPIVDLSDEAFEGSPNIRHGVVWSG